MPIGEQPTLSCGFANKFMPSRAWHIAAYLSVLAVSFTLHRFVYLNLKRVLLRDYPKRGERLAKWAKRLFVALDTPFLFLYFRSGMPEEIVRVTTGILYPFAVWQSIMLMWSVVLVPFVLWRRGKSLVALRRKDEDDNVEFEGQLEVVTES
jgi:hypothetical protein